MLNTDLVSFNEPSLNVAIATTNHQSRLHVDGVLYATAFRGDGSNFTNLDYIRWLKFYKRIYYNKGYVGIGLDAPMAHLHVSGNLQVTQNIVKESPPLLIIKNELISTFNGSAKQIKDFNASQFSFGSVNEDRLFGAYDGITGLGTLSAGLWNATKIEDPYVADNLKIVVANIENGSINGRLNMSDDVTLASQSYQFPVTISPLHWEFNKDAQFNSMQASKNILTNSLFSYVSTLNIVNNSSQTPVIAFNESGKIMTNGAAPQSKLSLKEGVRVGNSSIEAPGLIRLNTYFEAYSKDGGWSRLDMLGNFTGTSLYAENNIHSPVIKIYSGGKIGIHKKRPKEMTL